MRIQHLFEGFYFMENLKNEIWKPIFNYEGLYEVSNFGRLKTLKKLVICKSGISYELKEKINTLKYNGNNYTNAMLCKNKISKCFKMHRLVALAFITNYENKPCVNHKNGIKYDNRVENLEWVTYSENGLDRWKNHREGRIIILQEFIPKVKTIKSNILTEGIKFNFLTVIEKLDNNYWLFLCDCGNKKRIFSTSVKNGHTKSCGCLLKKSIKEKFTKHGLTKLKEYQIWCSIKGRCYNSNNKHFCNYGERNIKMSEEWLNNPIKFIEDMGLRPSNKHSIDRINNNGNYCKENCKWSTKKEQQNNRRVTIMVEYNNQNKPLTEWCDLLKLNYKRIESRIRLGWDYKDAFEKPLAHESNKLDENKVREIRKLSKKGLMYKEIAKIYNVDQTMIGLIIRGKSWKHVV